MRLLDLYCCQGGTSKGYQMAGFTEIIGVDIEAQPRYPYEFVQGDALEFAEKYGHEFDMIHASPPCQAHSVTKSLPYGQQHTDLVQPTRDILIANGKPYVIENVPGSPLINHIKLNGLMFGLKVLRERWFECSALILAPPTPKWEKWMTTASHRGYSSFANGATHISIAGHNFSKFDAGIAMGIDWMDRHGLSQSIPPAYTEWLGKEMLLQI